MITHPDKILFPDEGITKGELAAYYGAVAPAILPYLRNRPVTMERFPAGIGQDGFLQKDVSRGFPQWLKRVEVPKKGGVVHYPLITDLRSLMWVTNQNSITPHVWISRVPDLHHPDLCMFDLDPPEGEDAAVLRWAALALRDLLDELGLPSWVKTTGSKGFHIVVPVNGKSDIGEVGQFAHAVGATLAARHPDRLTQEFHKADRRGRILIDTGRNGLGATHASVYAVRAKAGAPVSAPCTWQEIEDGRVHPRSFTLRTMAARLDAVGDLWGDLRRRRRSLTRAIARLKRIPDAAGRPG